MDDKDRQTGAKSAQTEREKGAALEYDAEDENALDGPASPPVQENTTVHEEK